MLINVKMPTTVGIFTFISMLSTPTERSLYCSGYKFYERLKFHAQFYNLGASSDNNEAKTLCT